jgi:UDP-glucose 4-epimerase
MTKNLLVTGGLGFLGHAIINYYKSMGWRVVGIGNGAPELGNVSAQWADRWQSNGISVASLQDLEEVFDLVVHCAGNGSVQYGNDYPLQDFQSTVEGTAELLEYIRITSPNATVIYPSSAAVYGAKADAPISENDELSPISTYGYSKQMAELLCESYSRIYGLNVRVVRFFSIYGEGLRKQLIWDACNKISNATDYVEFAGTGEETRDFIHVDDACKLINAVAQSPKKFCIVNGATGIRVTTRSLLSKLRDRLNKDVDVMFTGSIRRGDPRFFHANIEKATNKNWCHSINLEDGLERYVVWFDQIACE